MIGKLKYVGKGQIVRVSDGALVSPRGLVSAYNVLLEMANDFRQELDEIKKIANKISRSANKEGK